MKELVKPNQEESIYFDAHAYCEVYCGGSLLGGGSYIYSVTYCPRADGCRNVVSDSDSDDILF